MTFSKDICICQKLKWWSCFLRLIVFCLMSYFEVVILASIVIVSNFHYFVQTSKLEYFVWPFMVTWPHCWFKRFHAAERKNLRWLTQEICFQESCHQSHFSWLIRSVLFASATHLLISYSVATLYKNNCLRSNETKVKWQRSTVCRHESVIMHHMERDIGLICAGISRKCTLHIFSYVESQKIETITT